MGGSSWTGDAVPWLTGRQPVGLRAARAYSCKALVSYCRQKGWDDSVSVTDPRQKAPILRLAAAMELREDEWELLNAAGKERAIVVAYRPARWPEEPVCGVIRRDGDGEQRLPVPVCTVMLVSRDRLPLAELVRRPPRPAGAGACVPGAADGTWGCIIRRAARPRRNYMIHSGTATAATFEKFLQQILDQTDSRPIHVIVDRHRIHTSKHIQAWKERTEAPVEIHLLPAYSPELNPTEQVWSVVKRRVGEDAGPDGSSAPGALGAGPASPWRPTPPKCRGSSARPTVPIRLLVVPCNDLWQNQ